MHCIMHYNVAFTSVLEFRALNYYLGMCVILVGPTNIYAHQISVRL